MSEKSKKDSKNWVKRVADSKGAMIMAPIGFSDRAKDIHAESIKLKEAERNFLDMREDFMNKNQNFWYELKKQMKAENVKIGSDEGIDYEIGINMEAIKDGVFIINVIPKSSGPMRM